MLFKDLGLSPEVVEAIESIGYSEATPIQEKTIPILMTGKDLTGQAQTGTGKTAAFGIPAIEHVDISINQTQSLILCPTRELALQVATELKKLSKFKKGLRVLAVYGGESIERQIKDLKFGAHIVVGTPGRIIDHLDRRTLNASNISQIILDEADEMLNMGFREDIELILTRLPEQRQTVLFSATLAPPILALAKRFQNNPEIIKIERKELTISTVEQFYYLVKNSQKTEIVTQIIDLNNLQLMLIFCNTKRKVEEVTDELKAYGHNPISLHGDKTQRDRTEVMNKFRKGQANILVATDVAARGIDVTGVDAVINYDVPLDIENYVHRIGRTGRAGLKGTAITLVEPNERYRLRMVENNTKARIVQATLPTPTELKQVLVRKEIKKFDTLIEKLDRLETDEVFAEKFADMDKADLLKVMYNHLFASQITRYDHAPSLEVAERRPDSRDNNRDQGRDFNRDSRDSGAGRSRDAAPQGRGTSTGNMRFFVNIGKDHGLTLKSLLGGIAGMVNVDERMIRNVDMKETFSFLEVPEQFGEVLLKTNNPMIIDRNVRFELTRSAPMSRPAYGGGDRDRRPSFRSGSNNRNANGGGYGGNRSEGRPSSERSFRS